MKRRSVLAAPLLGLAPYPGRAQAFPDRPFRIVVPYAPGGVTDTGARAMGERLEKILGPQMLHAAATGRGVDQRLLELRQVGHRLDRRLRMRRHQDRHVEIVHHRH